MSKIILKTPQQIQSMRKAGEHLQEIFEITKKHINPGKTLLEIDAIADDAIASKGLKPAFKGYCGFPNATCLMVNDQVVHSIPSDYVLQKGDLLSLDCGLYYEGMIADSAFSVVIGGDKENSDRSEFSQTVCKAMILGSQQAKIGNYTGDIGAVIEDYITTHGFSICREYSGHGVGVELHEDPSIFNFGTAGKGIQLQEGMTICIEPIVAMGKPETQTLEDEWTVITKDGSDACQWECFGAVGKNGLEIFA